MVHGGNIFQKGRVQKSKMIQKIAQVEIFKITILKNKIFKSNKPDMSALREGREPHSNLQIERYRIVE